MTIIQNIKNRARLQRNPKIIYGGHPKTHNFLFIINYYYKTNEIF